MRQYEPHEFVDGNVMVRTEVYTFPAFGESVTATYYGDDPDPIVGRTSYREG